MTEVFLVLVAVIGGLTEAVKRAGLDSRYAPIFAIVLGLVCTYFFVGKSPETLMQGLVASLTASGLYSGIKTTLSK